jgi:hypothetical protein
MPVHRNVNSKKQKKPGGSFLGFGLSGLPTFRNSYLFTDTIHQILIKCDHRNQKKVNSLCFCELESLLYQNLVNENVLSI